MDVGKEEPVFKLKINILYKIALVIFYTLFHLNNILNKKYFLLSSNSNI